MCAASPTEWSIHPVWCANYRSICVVRGRLHSFRGLSCDSLAIFWLCHSTLSRSLLPACCVNRMYSSSSVVQKGSQAQCVMSGRGRHTEGVHDPSVLSRSLASSVAKVPTPYRYLPANRLLSESFVSNDSSPWPNKGQQSHSDGKPGVLMLKYPWPTAAVSSGLVILDFGKEMPGAALLHSQTRTPCWVFHSCRHKSHLIEEGVETLV